MSGSEFVHDISGFTHTRSCGHWVELHTMLGCIHYSACAVAQDNDRHITLSPELQVPVGHTYHPGVFHALYRAATLAAETTARVVVQRLRKERIDTKEKLLLEKERVARMAIDEAVKYADPYAASVGYEDDWKVKDAILTTASKAANSVKDGTLWDILSRDISRPGSEMTVNDAEDEAIGLCLYHKAAIVDFSPGAIKYAIFDGFKAGHTFLDE
ncbi:hypothetical protein GGR57DRAFT_502837 [Xylariaceae sp. FL1272]|nr:hypothetical protein GGR57DRAFT_502837 [Xylariaceae sp. FL1272]